jgi:predicted PurR-regulated permease PerM
MSRHRQYVLAALLASLAVLSAIVLGAVLRTVVFAITVAYVLYPLKRWLLRHGASDRIGSAAATVASFVAVAFLFGPLAVLVYERREQFIGGLQETPESLSVSIGGFEFAVDTEPFVARAVELLQELAVDVAVAVPGLALQFALFTLVVYGVLYKPRAIRGAVYGAVPHGYHDVLDRLHRRVRKTLFALYVLQGLTAFATFPVSLVLFWLLGYEAVLSLAVIAGILQFIPILGPSLLLVGLAAADVLAGLGVRAALVLVLGGAFVALGPDAVVRLKLAGKTGELPSSLYFIGFVGGVLTVGAIGIIVGPLVVALLIETVALLSEENGSPPAASEAEDGS